MKKDLENREELLILVNSFYNLIKKDALLSPIFLKIIPENMWQPHIEKITDFWSSIIFSSIDYSGNPVEKHIEVDKKSNYKIDQNHFDQWLGLWYQSIDNLYMGKNANILKDRARNIAHIMWIKIFSSRKT